METVAHRVTDRRLILSRYRISFRQTFRLAAAAVSKSVSASFHQIQFHRPSRVTALVMVTAVVAAISLGTALWWSASAAPNPKAASHRSRTITQTAEAFTVTDAGLDARRARPAELVASDRAARLSFIKAEKAQMAAKRRAAAARAAARERAQQRAAASSRAAQPGSAGLSVQLSGSPEGIASAMLGTFGWGQDQFQCLVSLWSQESGWNPGAANPSSGAYGIPQALPGSKMASAGADWETNPATQIRWGLGYIQGSYGSPCGAWSHEEASGWY